MIIEYSSERMAVMDTFRSVEPAPTIDRFSAVTVGENLKFDDADDTSGNSAAYCAASNCRAVYV